MMRPLQHAVLGLSVLLGFSIAAEDRPTHLTHANHIFNAIHSSMRQWGSSLNHNGMSMFIASVPEGIQLYHGSSDSATVNGTEWLAFEPEHAGNFARCRRRPPGRPGPPPADGHQSKNRERGPFAQPVRPQRRHPDSQPEDRSNAWPQIPLGLDSQEENDDCGYLHTYRTKHDLRLLYLDGQSAAKSGLGTLDVQDLVLLHSNPPELAHDQEDRYESPSEGPPKNTRGPGPMNEYARATSLCRLAREEWQGRIDGFIRMELGFEVILCSFEDHLVVDRITRVSQSALEPQGSLENYRAIASRFDGIGGGRVAIDYDSFVTLFSDVSALYFDEKGMPRVHNVTKVIEPIQQAITEMALSDRLSITYDWQTLTDMVVSRYSDRIEYLASGDLIDHQEFKRAVESALRPFIDFAARNRSAEIQRCATQHFQHSTSPNSTAGLATLDVTTALCTALTEASEEKSLGGALAVIRHLKTWLSWTTWKRCRGCTYREVCFAPVWPLGGPEDFKHPKCVSNMSEISRGYWEGWDGPPRDFSHDAL